MPAPVGRRTTIAWGIGMAVHACCVAAGAQDMRRPFHVPRGPAGPSIQEFARQADVNVLASSSSLAGIATNEVSGSLSVSDALAKLLAGTGLSSRVTPNGTIFIMAPPAPSVRPAAKSGRVDEQQVIVTGSRLVSRGYSAPSPTTVLTDVEIAQLTEHFLSTAIRQHGRYFEVKPDTVLEIAFDKLQPSTRHSSGLAMRFPRIVRIRTDKTIEEIDTLTSARRTAGLPS